MSDIVFCVNCVHYLKQTLDDTRYPVDRCKHPNTLRYDLVNGGIQYAEAYSMRKSVCGFEGRLYEEKKETK